LLAYDGQGFANYLPVTANHLRIACLPQPSICQRFASDSQACAICQRFASTGFACDGHAFACQRPSIYQRFACPSQSFANALPVTAKAFANSLFAYDGQGFANGLPVTARHLPTACL
jgi:hypothetical protein